MKRILNILLCLSVITATAQKVDYSIIEKVANNFYSSKSPVKSALSLSYVQTNNTDTLFYVFNQSTNGFVIIANDYAINPILAYSTEQSFDVNNMSPELKWWLGTYSQKIEHLKTNLTRTKIANWDKYYSNLHLKSLDDYAPKVDPLIKTLWNQNENYNYFCPESEYPEAPDGKCYAGCVATSMAQVMKYYNYPDKGFGKHSYYHPFYGNLGLDFSQETFDWEKMTAVINPESKEAIAKLIYACGISVNMDYSHTGSGSQTEYIPNALTNNFKYRSSIKSLDKSNFTHDKWIETLCNELNEKRPIIYSGQSEKGGHAWVCDGYKIIDTVAMFHMNWGWSGSGNGFFLLDSLNSGNGNFSTSQGAVIGITPYFSDYCTELKITSDSIGEITDGSGFSTYWNNTDCDWLIRPDNGPIHLSFTKLNTETDKDTVSIYDGLDKNAPLLGVYSGSTLPEEIIAQSGNAYITFNSDSQNNLIGEDGGWAISYYTGISGISTLKSTEFNIYPNPTNDVLNVKFNNIANNKNSIEIYNTFGQLIINATITNGKINSIDVSSLSTGVYQVRILNDKTLIGTQKLIKK